MLHTILADDFFERYKFMDFVIRYLIMCGFFAAVLPFEISVCEEHYALNIILIFIFIGLIFLL